MKIRPVEPNRSMPKDGQTWRS